MRLLGFVDDKPLFVEWNSEYNQVRYILEDEEIGVYDPNRMTEDMKIIFFNDTNENKLSAEIKETIKELAKDVDANILKEDAEKYGEVKLEEIEEAIELEEDEEIDSITEIDLDEDEEEKEKEKEEEIEEKEQEEEKEEEIFHKKDEIDIKQEIQMDAMATTMKTIGKVLEKSGKLPNIPGKKFTKLGIVSSHRVKDIDPEAKTNTTRFSFVAIATDGTVVPVDLEQDHQEEKNPEDVSYEVKTDGRVEKKDAVSRYVIGDNEETLSINFSKGPGNLEIGYSAHKTLGGNGIEGNVSVDHQLQTNTVYNRPKKESMQKEYSGGKREAEQSVREGNNKSEQDKQYKRDEVGLINDEDANENIDGNEQTESQQYEKNWEERAKEFLNENPEVDRVFTEREVIAAYKEAYKKGAKSGNVKEELKKAEDNLCRDAEMLPSIEKR